LDYHYYLRRRTELEDREILLERQCQLLNPEVWAIVYQGKLMSQLGLSADEGEGELTEDDIPDLDAFMAEQERQWVTEQTQEQKFQEALTGTRTMTGAQAPLDWREIQSTSQAAPLQWSNWQ
jgi:hypothetical protein